MWRARLRPYLYQSHCRGRRGAKLDLPGLPLPQYLAATRAAEVAQRWRARHAAMVLAAGRIAPGELYRAERAMAALSGLAPDLLCIADAEQPARSWCGRPLPDIHFASVDRAAINARRGSRLHACFACVVAVARAFGAAPVLAGGAV